VAWNTFNTQIGSYLLEVLVKNTGSLAAYDTFTTIPYAMQLCNSPTLSTLPATSPYVSGSGAITLTANGTCQGTTEFAFFYKDPGGVFHVIQGYSTAKTAPWAADFKAGHYQLLVEIRPQGSGLPYVTFLYMPFTLSGCANATLSPSVASPQVAGDTVTFTASATCSGTATFSFYVLSPGGVWSNPQGYSTNNTFVWVSPTTTGTYLVEVLARNSGAVEDPYDSFSAIPNYMLGLCSAATLNTSAASNYPSGSGPITLTGGGHCAGGTEFQFYYQDLAGGFHLIQAYSVTTTAPWPADFKAGTYPLLVELRPTGSSAAYVTFLYKPFTLTGCSAPNLAPDKASPQVGGTVVTFTATVTCTGTPSYSFWVLSPSSVWTNAQPYGASSTFAWSSPTAPGAYLVEVLVRNNGANEDPYDSFFAITNYMLILCSPETLSTLAATSPYISGSGAITLTGAATARAGPNSSSTTRTPPSAST